jgi:hypothetical protein
MVDGNVGQDGEEAELPPAAADLVRDLRNPEAKARGRGLELLAQRYGRPVSAYLGAVSRQGGPAGEELARAFFSWLSEGGHLLQFDPSRASLRAFLKGLLPTFGKRNQAHASSADLPHARNAAGGDASSFPLETSTSPDPDAAFEQAFLEDSVRRAVVRVRASYQASRRLAPILAFEQYYLTRVGPSPTYALVARRLGLKERDIRDYLQEVREAVRAEARVEFQRDGGEPPPEVATLFKG